MLQDMNRPDPEDDATLADIKRVVDRIEVRLMGISDSLRVQWSMLWILIALAGFIAWKLF